MRLACAEVAFRREVEQQSAQAAELAAKTDTQHTRLMLTMHVVDETCLLPLMPGTHHHGIAHNLFVSPGMRCADLVGQCKRGMPTIARPGYRWCLCWGTQLPSGVEKPGPRIEVKDEGAPWSNLDYTLAEADVQNNDVLWLHYLNVKGSWRRRRAWGKGRSVQMMQLVADEFSGIPTHAKPWARGLIRPWYPYTDHRPP